MNTDAVDSEIFDSILHRERLKNAQRINLLRFRAVSLFLVANVTVILLHGSPGSVSRLPAFICYWLIAIAIWLASKNSARLAHLGSIGIPLFDIPMVFWLQHSALATTSNKVALAEITVGLYVALIVEAMLSLERWDIPYCLKTQLTCKSLPVLSKNSSDIRFSTSIVRDISYKSPGTNSDLLDVAMIYLILLL